MSAVANSQVAAVFSPQADVANAFVSTLCGPGTFKCQINLNGLASVVLETPPIESISTLAEHIKSADFSVLLLRFLDVDMLESARSMLRALPPNLQGRVHVAIARQADEAEFKMSCPKCGQKLMIKDALAFRRTQCPRCKHPFTIPGQADLVRKEFLIPPERKVTSAVLGDVDSCLNVLAAAYQQSGRRRSDVHSTTMRLDFLIPDEES